MATFPEREKRGGSEGTAERAPWGGVSLSSTRDSTERGSGSRAARATRGNPARVATARGRRRPGHFSENPLAFLFLLQLGPSPFSFSVLLISVL